MTSRIYPQSQLLCVDENTSPFIQFGSQAIESQSESAHEVRQRVKQAIRNGDFLRAIAWLNRLIMHDPMNAENHNNRGLVYFRQGSLQRAFVDFNRAIALDPELPAAYNNRGNYYAAQGLSQLALDDYQQAIALNPFHVRARINQAVTLRELGRFDEALIGFEDALLFRQFDSKIYAERGRTYHLRGDWNCAIADYHRALEALSTTHQLFNPAHQSRHTQIMGWLRELHPAA